LNTPVTNRAAAVSSGGREQRWQRWWRQQRVAVAEASKNEIRENLLFNGE